MQICILNYILKFSQLVVGVNGNKYGAYLDSGKHNSEPVGYIISPYTYVASLCNTDFHKSFGHLVDPVVKLGIGQSQSYVGVTHEVMVGFFLPPFMNHQSYVIIDQI